MVRLCLFFYLELECKLGILVYFQDIMMPIAGRFEKTYISNNGINIDKTDKKETENVIYRNNNHRKTVHK